MASVDLGRRIVLLVLALAFFGLAVAAAVKGAPWYLPPLWVISGIVLLMLLGKVGGLRRTARPAADDDPLRRAQRSGNPAVRATAEDQQKRR